MTQRILIVDDEEDIRTVAAMALDVDPNLDVRTCGSGAEGRQIAEWWQPDLILLDVRMPGLSGPETLNELRSGSRTASIPVIFFTASVQKHEKDELAALGAQGIIMKPFDPLALASQIAPFLPAASAGQPPAPAGEPVVAEGDALISLLYVSKSILTPAEADIEVARIVATARSRNAPQSITGALIFTQTHFAQFLEGPQSAIDELIGRLQLDPRHEDIRIVQAPPFTRRHFSDWSMAYGGSSLFISNLVQNVFEDQAAVSDADKLIRLMREFTNDVRSAA